MPMYNLLKYRQNSFMTLGKLWEYCRDKVDDINDNTSDGQSYICKQI